MAYFSEFCGTIPIVTLHEKRKRKISTALPSSGRDNGGGAYGSQR